MTSDFRFRTTHWSVVLQAGAADDSAARRALSMLCELYWYPVYAFLRRRGHARAEAEDLAQGFFARLLERNDFARADPERGRFRSYLLKALTNHVANVKAAARTHKRGGGRVVRSLDLERAEQRYGLEPACGETPELLFERNWAVLLLEKALDGVCRAQRQAGKEAIFDQLKPFLVGGAPAGGYGAAAAALGMTEGAVKVAVHRLRRAYGAQLRALVLETVADPDEVDGEIQALLDALGARS